MLLSVLIRWLNRAELWMRLKSESLEQHIDRIDEEIKEQKRPKPYTKKMFL